MANEYRDDYGTFVFNNYVRNCELAEAAAKAVPIEEAAADLMRRSTETSATRNRYPQTVMYMPIPALESRLKMRYASKRSPWPTLREEREYLSLDSDSDSGDSYNSGAVCHCRCYTESVNSASNYDSSDRGSNRICNCNAGKNRQSSRSAKRSESKKRCSACGTPLDNMRGRTKNASANTKSHYSCTSQRATKPLQIVGQSQVASSMNPIMRPGPYGKHPEPDILLYPI